MGLYGFGPRRTSLWPIFGRAQVVGFWFKLRGEIIQCSVDLFVLLGAIRRTLGGASYFRAGSDYFESKFDKRDKVAG